jgi:magnesium transporter
VSEATDRIIARALAEGHPAAAARVLERFDSGQCAGLLAEWIPQPAASVLELMMPDLAVDCLARLPPRSAREVLAGLDLDSAAGLLRRAAEDARQALLAGMGQERREPLLRLLAQREGTAGALMDPLVPDLPDDIDAQAALRRVSQAARRALAYVYVVDRAGRLGGVVSLHDLVKAPPRARLAGLMRGPVMCLQADDDRRSILAHPGWDEFHALPVVDQDRRLLGVVRYETLRRIDAESSHQRTESAVSVAVSLGELFWLGLSGLVDGLGRVALRAAPDEGRR